MNKLKKLLALSLAAMTIISSMCIPAMAKETIEGENGVIIEIYNSDVEEIPQLPQTRDIDNFYFDLTVPVNPSFVYLTSTQVIRNMTLDNGQSVIDVAFDEADCYRYITVYDVTAGNYVIGSSTSLYYVGSLVGDYLRVRNLTGGHTYRIALSNVRSVRATGNVISY